ncbi:hypothetical protein DCC62_12610 [candidate division KSB1 bacterium]|nr:MAG: hypothetical protein DCC62_12610 [candidate division KSB1 bacterium]
MMKRISVILTAFLFLSVAEQSLFAQEKESTKVNMSMTQLEALFLIREGKYHEAIPLAEKALVEAGKKYAPNSLEIAFSQNMLARLYYSIGSYSKAESLYLQLLPIYEKVLGPEHKDLAEVLSSLGSVYEELGAYAKAESLLKRAFTIREKVFGPEHEETLVTLNNLAVLSVKSGSFSQAILLMKKALMLYEKMFGPEHPRVAIVLNNLANAHKEVGQLVEAELLLRRALEICETPQVTDCANMANILNDLGGLYYVLGSYSQAESFLKRSLAIREQSLGSEHIDVAVSLNNLAELYRRTGRYIEAGALLKRALSIMEKVLGEQHPTFARGLNNLSQLYQDMGNHTEAEVLLKRALEIDEKFLGPAHPNLVEELNNLAVLYRSIGSYANAERLYLRALTITEKAREPEHPLVAMILDNLALVYDKMGSYVKAYSFYQRALAITEKNLGPEHPDVAIVLNNLAGLHESMGSHIDAEPLYRRSLLILEKAMGPAHLDVVTSLNNLALLCAAIGKIDSSISLAKYVTNLEFNLYHQILPYLSEKQQINFIEQNQPLSSILPSLYLQHGIDYEDLEFLAEEVLINNKGLVLEILTARSRKIKAGDKSIVSLKDSLNEVNAQLANLNFTGIRQRKSPNQHLKLIQLISEQREKLEDELVQKGHTPDSRKTRVNAMQISQAISEDYVLVDFWYFREYVSTGKKKGWGKWNYLASVFQSNKSPELIDLGEADPMHKSIVELRSAILAGDLDKSPSKQQNAEALIKAKGKQLWQQLFRPLLPAFGEKKKVIICADGALHYLPFGVLVDEQNRYLVESYQFHYVSTSREIVQWARGEARGKGARGKIDEAVIIADPKFDFSSTSQVASSASKSIEQEFLTRHSRDWRQMGFSQLKYTGPEAVAIDSLLKQKGIATKLYLQAQAQESVLKSVVSPQILHISTHGFFLPDQPELRKPKEIGGFSSIGEFDRMPALENPLLRCGLAFTGANHAESVKDGEDGLATAMEIAGLDLQGTDLVTLSACLTGVGELRSGEGVYGLHRSFLLAGAKTVLASLWSVPDLETKDLMIEFYSRYLFGENIGKSEALRQAQLAVIEQLRKKYGTAHPAYWGAFICIGEP